MNYDVVVVGAGPGGLRCAELLAEHGARTLVIERNRQLGRKACAGGVTRGGLLQSLPDNLIQRKFSFQTIRTRYQQGAVGGRETMIATVNRVELGVFMAARAQKVGAVVETGARLERIEAKHLVYRASGSRRRVAFDYLVGADGAASRVRSWLKVDAAGPKCGIGIHYLIGGSPEEMVWNFDPNQFGSGYTWLFPHRREVSAGAYLADHSLTPMQLKGRLDAWLRRQGLDPTGSRFEADRINIDFRGWSFGRVFLVGDAAGLASPLTGEGINPAVVSAEAVARTIIDPRHRPERLERLIARHRAHRRMLGWAGRSGLFALVLSELCAFLLRHRLIGFDKFEMA